MSKQLYTITVCINEDILRAWQYPNNHKGTLLNLVQRAVHTYNPEAIEVIDVQPIDHQGDSLMLRSQATYYVLHSSTDSALSVEAMDAEELASKLENDHWGENPVVHGPELPEQIDGYIQGDHEQADLIIIKGEVVIPKPVQTVIRYAIP